MAKDKMVLLLKDVWVNDIRELRGWKYLISSHRIYKHGILIYHKDEIFLKLMKYSPQKGDLYIDFNPAKIKYGEIDSLNMDIFYGEICMLLDRELRGIFRCDTFFETNKNKLNMFKGEIYIDITINKEESEALFRFIRKIDIPRMKINLKYMGSGTIYFYGGNNLSSSNIVFKIYKKHEELKTKRYHINSSVGIIRFELVLKRRKLLYDYKNAERLKRKKSYQVFHDIAEEHEDIKNIANIDYETSGDFETLSSTLYQFQKLYEFIVQKCNLNKIITTRDILIDTIISRTPPTLCKKLCNYVKYVNGENTTMNVSKKTLSRYKKMILDLGYHYLYSDIEIQPLHLEELFFKHLYYSSAA